MRCDVREIQIGVEDEGKARGTKRDQHFVVCILVLSSPWPLFHCVFASMTLQAVQYEISSQEYCRTVQYLALGMEWHGA